MEQVYKYLDASNTAYILRDGVLINQISDMDNFELTGKNIIFGAGEILLQEKEGLKQFRYKDVYISDGSHYEELVPEKIIALFKSPKLGYAVAKTIAISLTKVNDIFQHRCKELTKSAHLVQEYCKIYASACDVILEEYKQKRYLWLEEVHNKAVQSLSYHKGRAFIELGKARSIKVEAQMNELDKLFPHGGQLCKQGDASNDMFILRSGTIHVLVGGNKVAEITEPGTLIGEMALLLSQKRSATLQAHGNVTVSIINKENVTDVIRNDPNFFLNIATTHSRWEANNCFLIRELDEQLKLQQKEKDLPKFLRSENKYKEEVYDLKKDISDLNLKYNFKFLDDIEDIIFEGIEKVSQL